MSELAEVAPAFVEMAHRIVWASVATVDRQGRPRTRILHPLWVWEHGQLVGWIATSPTPTKRGHLAGHPYASVSYWAPSHDTCAAECRATLHLDDATRTMVWDLFTTAPAPVGYTPSIVPAWTAPTADAFAAMRLEPWRLRVFPGTVLLGQGGTVLSWQEP
jgi:hypothetical protein